MARRILVPFAENGDFQEIPMDAQPDDTVSYDEGYTFDYSRPAGSSPLAKEVGRQKFNGLMQDITGNIKDYQENGAPEWFEDTDYARGARVKHSGDYWTCIIESGTTDEEPGTGEDWTQTTIPARARKDNLTATAAPTADDDETLGYEPLSSWINTVTTEIYTCISAAEGAAHWELGTLTPDQLGNVALLNANTVGQNIIQLSNPSAIRYLRINADNTITLLDADGLAADLSASLGIPVREEAVFTGGGNFTGYLRTSRVIYPDGSGQGFLQGHLSATAIGGGVGAPDTITTLAVGWRPRSADGDVNFRICIEPFTGPGTLAPQSPSVDMSIRIVPSTGAIQTIYINGSGEFYVNGTWFIPPT
jgi:hypothetical protein